MPSAKNLNSYILPSGISFIYIYLQKNYQSIPVFHFWGFEPVIYWLQNIRVGRYNISYKFSFLKMPSWLLMLRPASSRCFSERVFVTIWTHPLTNWTSLHGRDLIHQLLYSNTQITLARFTSLKKSNICFNNWKNAGNSWDNYFLSGLEITVNTF